MEVAQYGDTEISASDLKPTIEKLKRIDRDKTRPRIDDEFEVNHFPSDLFNSISGVNKFLF